MTKGNASYVRTECDIALYDWILAYERGVSDISLNLFCFTLLTPILPLLHIRYLR
jgi:hypothetical protein